MDICLVLAYLGHDGYLGRAEINLKLRHHLKYRAPDLGGDLRRGHRETLVTAPRVSPEGRLAAQESGNVAFCGCFYRLNVLFGLNGAGNGGYSEYLPAEPECLFYIGIVVKRLYVNGALYVCHREIAGFFKALFHVAVKQLFKISAVESLKGELTVFTEKYFFHFQIPYSFDSLVLSAANLAQMSESRHSPHRGDLAQQVSLPKSTSL